MMVAIGLTFKKMVDDAVRKAKYCMFKPRVSREKAKEKRGGVQNDPGTRILLSVLATAAKH